jgi:hypothetical protein
MKSNFDSPFTKYISGNFISSLPMELLTNQTALKRMFVLDDDNSNKLSHFGIAFNTSHRN